MASAKDEPDQATPSPSESTPFDASHAPQTFTVYDATATLTPAEGRRAPTLRIESLPLRMRILREVVDYERKQTLRNKSG